MSSVKSASVNDEDNSASQDFPTPPAAAYVYSPESEEPAPTSSNNPEAASLIVKEAVMAVAGLQCHRRRHLSRLSSLGAAPASQRLYSRGILHCGEPLWSGSGKKRFTEGLQLSRTGPPSILHRSKYACRVDASLARQCESEQLYWKEVLRRVVAVIKFLGARGLPFRGDKELLSSAHNGNYLGLLELIAEFDPFLKEHLEKHGNKGRAEREDQSWDLNWAILCIYGKDQRFL
ncbi:zinc finger MYM-type 1-like protein [Labeo rohita]|uniref:Zinc finger MYM-type 1-like protein n=1 Tax=Labeo rohita TaxID=84645 RepID=A0A498P3M5_LABRO|nr:zinc finger MYM-type 1-like protein [Labeo rohita]